MIQSYVQNYLKNCNAIFLQDIIDHGIYNLACDVWQGEDYAQAEAIAAEFEHQALCLICGSV